jgi:hypothetical protein
MTLSIMGLLTTFSITTLSIMGLFTTLSITTLSITIHSIKDTQHKRHSA